MAKKNLYGICDNRCHLFRNETINKENALRMKWFLKNEQRLIENLGSEKLAARVRASMTARKEEAKRRKAEPSVEIPVRYRLPPWRPPITDDSVNLDFMRPIEPEVREILYEKGVESSIATNNYLLERWKKLPENRYYYPDCASWIYGWRLKDYPEIPLSKVGMKSVMQTEFYFRTRSCLQRDPPWYRETQTKNAKNFNELLTY